MPIWREAEPGYRQIPGPPHIVQQIRNQVLQDLLAEVVAENEQAAIIAIERLFEKMPDDEAFDVVRVFVEERRNPGRDPGGRP